MKTITVTPDLLLELWPAGENADYPMLRLRRGQGGETGTAVELRLHEIRGLVAALAAGAAELAALTVEPPGCND